MNKLVSLFEKNFQKWENKKRQKYDTKTFLYKYIASFTSNIKFLAPLYIANIVIDLFCTVIFLAIFILGHDTFYLIISIVWAICAILWIFNLIFVKYKKRIWNKRIEEWKVELNEINQKTTN